MSIALFKITVTTTNDNNDNNNFTCKLPPQVRKQWCNSGLDFHSFCPQMLWDLWFSVV